MKVMTRSVLFFVLATTLYKYVLTIVQDISLNTKQEAYVEEKWFGTKLKVVNREILLLTNASENSGNRDRNPNGQNKSTIKQPTKESIKYSRSNAQKVEIPRLQQLLPTVWIYTAHREVLLTKLYSYDFSTKTFAFHIVGYERSDLVLCC